VLRILVVDDHATILEHAGRWVERTGVAQVVGLCQDPSIAVAAYQRVRPDVLLTDLQMPVLDGLGLTRAVLSVDALACVVVFSAQHKDGLEAGCLAAGARGFITKSASSAELAAVLVAARRAAGHRAPGERRCG
jgi:CheY-like chemotaxis protein